MPLSFKECPGLRSRLCCNERLASAFVIPPNAQGGRTPLDERDGLPVVHSKSVRLQTFRPFTSRLSTRIQPIGTPQCTGAIGEIDSMYVCFYKEQTKK